MAEVPNPQPLTEQQRRFREEYAARPNATQAYRRAFPGVTYKTANVEGCKLLANPSVQAEVEVARDHYRRAVRTEGPRPLVNLRNSAEVEAARAVRARRPKPP